MSANSGNIDGGASSKQSPALIKPEKREQSPDITEPPKKLPKVDSSPKGTIQILGCRDETRDKGRDSAKSKREDDNQKANENQSETSSSYASGDCKTPEMSATKDAVDMPAVAVKKAIRIPFRTTKLLSCRRRLSFNACTSSDKTWEAPITQKVPTPAAEANATSDTSHKTEEESKSNAKKEKCSKNKEEETAT